MASKAKTAWHSRLALDPLTVKLEAFLQSIYDDHESYVSQFMRYDTVDIEPTFISEYSHKDNNCRQQEKFIPPPIEIDMGTGEVF